jgi:hypothetical protein
MDDCAVKMQGGGGGKGLPFYTRAREEGNGMIRRVAARAGSAWRARPEHARMATGCSGTERCAKATRRRKFVAELAR